MDMQNIPHIFSDSLELVMAYGGLLTILILTGALGIAVVWFLWKPVKMPPGPRRIPILGSLDIVGMDETKFHYLLTELSNKYGDIYSFYMGNRYLVVLNSYDIVKEAFVTKAQVCGGRKFESRFYARNPYGQSKGIADPDISEEWKLQRNTALTIMRSLGWGKDSLETRIQEEATYLLQYIKNMQGQVVDMGSQFFQVFVSNVICSLLFGQRNHIEDKSFQSLVANIGLQLKGMSTDSDAEFIPILKLFRPNYQANRAKLFEAGAKITKYVQGKIEEGKEKLRNGDEPVDFVTLYLAELSKVEHGKSRIKEDWLEAIVNDFFFAGSETTAITLTWAVLFMMLNPDIQAKVQQELDRLAGKRNYTFSLSDREKAPYTEATLMEIMRKGPVAPIAIPHKAVQDVEIAGYMIHKDTEIWSNLYKLHNDPKVWDSPETFSPERFLSEDNNLVKQKEWVPFSMGKRSCLGEQLARQELFLFFSHLVHRFTVLVPEGELKPTDEGMFTLLLKPHPFKVCFKPRW